MSQLRFGKYKGMEVSDVAKDQDGVNYLSWLRDNTDANDPKYGKNNALLLAELNRALDGKTIYVKEKKNFPKKTAQGASVDLSGVEKKLDKILAILKKNFGDHSVEEDETPF